MNKNKNNIIELDENLLNENALEYTAVIVGRDLSSYLIALILAQAGHRVAIAVESNKSAMLDLYEYISLKYLYEAARRIRSIHSLYTKGLNVDSSDNSIDFDWKRLTHECKKEFTETKTTFEKEIITKNINIYNGKILMIEDNIVRIISEDELKQIAMLRTKNVIIGSDVNHCTIPDYSNRINNTIKSLIDLINTDQLPQSLTVIGAGNLGLAVASCMKELGCVGVKIIEQKTHCLMNMSNIDGEIAAFMEASLIKQDIDIITECNAHFISDTGIHINGKNETIKSDYQFLAIGTRRMSNSISNTLTPTLIQLLERISFGRKLQIGKTISDANGQTIVIPSTSIIPIDYQQIKSFCSVEQGISIAYRTICKTFNSPKPNFLMPSFIYTIHPLMLIGQTRIPADNMFICRISIPPTMKYAIDTPPRGFGKLWISRVSKTLCGVQLVSEHAFMFAKAFGILIRNQIYLSDLCNRTELPGSIGEAVQLMMKQAMYNINNKNAHINLKSN